MQQQCGILYVVATPIGNLADITERARSVLAEVDVVAAEDTRDSGRLLAHLGIRTRLVAYHEHNEANAAEGLIGLLESGQNVAVISDAGTPLISDPGFDVVRLAREQGMEVVPVPGPSALICALCAAGLPSDRFLFLGFPPRTAQARRTWFEEVATEPGTLIFYESGKRVQATLSDLGEVLGTRRVVVARELTKKFETFLHGSAQELLARMAEEPEQCLGEFVLLVEGRPAPVAGTNAEHDRVLAILAEDLPLRQAVALAARLCGAKKNALYKRALELGLDAAGQG